MGGERVAVYGGVQAKCVLLTKKYFLDDEQRW